MVSKNTPDLDYHRLLQVSESLRAGKLPAIRLAIIDGPQQLTPLLKALFAENGFDAQIYDGSEEPGPDLYRFTPEFVVIAGSGHAPGVMEEAQRLRVWDELRAHTQARIIQFNYALPHENDSGYSDITQANAGMAQLARERGNILLCDVEAMSSWVGREQWHKANAFCDSEFLPLVAQSIVEIVLSARGRVTKCIVLDLDNTLWGGVVGDDGPLGIAIGAHGDGEPFYHFQQYLLTLKQRGILLAVCSKNEMANALAAFSDNPEMVLKRDDITVFIANWENKADNLRKIRDTLEIGLDSMVFLDDNPFERNLVRQLAPEVIVPELPEDPADYVRALSSLNLFEATSFSAEDVLRAELYQQEAGRREVQSSFSNIDDYLKSLCMKMELSRFTKPKLGRITQLIQRSNQFNLTTHRYNEAECETLMLDLESSIPLYATLSDKFGDHGLISVVVLRIEAQELHITDWLMSCRVLVRGVEQTIMNHAVRAARERGLKSIRAEYIPSAKNAMVKDFYAQFGFEKIADEGGRTLWLLDPVLYEVKTTYVETVEP